MSRLILEGKPQISLIQMLGTQYYRYIINDGFDSMVKISPVLGYNKGDRILAKTEIGNFYERLLIEKFVMKLITVIL